jgi:membrane associated rhomboid family serine protease
MAGLLAQVLSLTAFMTTTFFLLLVLSAVGVYFTTPDERRKLARSANVAIRQGIRAATESTPDDPFEGFLQARTGRPLVTPLLAALNVVVFVLMLVGPGAFGDSQTLIAWGGNVAPRTTNGEWWRLIAATFVHGGLLHLLATIAGLVPLGLILERAVGRLAFAAVYLASGMLASLVALWTMEPTSVSVGASGAVFGIYGLLLAAVLWWVVSSPPVPVPLITVKRLAAAAGFFFLYNMATDYVGMAAELTGLAVGFAGGLVMTSGIVRETAGVRRSAMVMGTAIAIAFAAAFPLRGIIDARPELAQLAALEERTAVAYDAAVVRYRNGSITSDALVQHIDRTIIPELRAIHARLTALHGVPTEQAPLVAAASEYCQLREQSWRRRSEGLHKLDARMLRQADETERAALKAFQKIRPTT